MLGILLCRVTTTLGPFFFDRGLGEGFGFGATGVQGLGCRARKEGLRV